MKPTFRTTLIGASLLALLATSGASVAGPRDGERRGHAERFADTLQLDDNQRQAMADIFREQRQAQQQVRAETQSKIASILSAEQKQTLAELRAKREARWEERKARMQERREARAERGEGGERAHRGGHRARTTR